MFVARYVMVISSDTKASQYVGYAPAAPAMLLAILLCPNPHVSYLHLLHSIPASTLH
jgi:hypothetical protein